MRLDRCTAVVPQHETAIAVSIGGTLRVLRAALTLSARVQADPLRGGAGRAVAGYTRCLLPRRCAKSPEAAPVE
jgi:hypothetical protein